MNNIDRSALTFALGGIGIHGDLSTFVLVLVGQGMLLGSIFIENRGDSE